MKVLVTNDDGIHATGLSLLTQWAREHGHEVAVAAPTQNCSGQSAAITMDKPLAVTEMGPSQWAVAGTPADCVRVALAFFSFKPDVVLSGINHGANLGLDVHASGTVGAARMAAVRGIPAVAISAHSLDWTLNSALWHRHGPAVVEAALRHGPSSVLSLNLPSRGGARLVYAELSGYQFNDELQWAQFDGRHHIIQLGFSEHSVPHHDARLDVGALSQGFCTLTYLPLNVGASPQMPKPRESASSPALMHGQPEPV